jgi:hypothetical protein
MLHNALSRFFYWVTLRAVLLIHGAADPAQVKMPDVLRRMGAAKP